MSNEEWLREAGWEVCDNRWCSRPGMSVQMGSALAIQSYADAAEERGRREALEEAAKVCDSLADKEPPPPRDGEWWYSHHDKRIALEGAAESIRALMEAVKPAGKQSSGPQQPPGGERPTR